MKKQFYIVSLAVAGLFGHANAQCGWVPVGPNDSNRIGFGETKYTSVAVDPTTNNTLVAYRDGDCPNYYAGSVAMYSGGKWSQLGAPGLSKGEVYASSICVDKHGTPYVAFEDKGILDHCTVWKYSAGIWDTLAGQVGLNEPAQFESVATDKNAVPYVAYEDLGKPGLKLDVMMWNGAAWLPVGGALGISGGQAQYVSLAFDTVNNIPYVAYEDGKNGDKLMVLSYNGTAWSTVGGATYATGITTDTVNFVSMVVDKNGHPYVGYEDFSDGMKLSVMMYNGTTWVADTANSGTVLSKPITNPSIGVDASDNLYAAYIDNSYYGYGGLTIADNLGSGWNYVSSFKKSQDISAKAALYVSLALDNTGTPVVAYEDKGVGNHAMSFKWNSVATRWDLQGSLGLSNGSNPASGHNGLAAYTSVAISPTGSIPYIAYADGNNSNKATVMNYTSGAWNVVGTAGISVKTAKFTNMGFDKAGDPIIMYSDYGAAPKYSVSCMKYSAGTWSPVGTNANAISGTYAYYVSMAVSANDSIYACYENGNYHMSVMACPSTGTTWSNIGAADITGDSAAYQSVAIDKNGVPYIAFQDNASHSLALCVMKYSGGAWQYVGSRDITGTGAGADATEISIQIDPVDNMPVVAYSAYNSSQNENCVKFNGTTWAWLGKVGFSNDWTGATSLSISKIGTCIVTYSDWGNEVSTLKGLQGQENVTVEEFNPKTDTAWHALPLNGSASNNGSEYESSAIDPSTGTLYVAYTGFGAFVKMLNCPTGIDEIKGSSETGSANVYPNPNHGSFTVALQNAPAKSYINVYNVLGEKVYESTLNADKTQVNLNFQATGMYLYRILTEGGDVISTGKLIIQ